MGKSGEEYGDVLGLERRIEKKWKRLLISKVETYNIGKIADNKNQI